MFKLNNYNYNRGSLLANRVGFDNYIERNDYILSENYLIPSSRNTIAILKDNSEFIPITCAVNNSIIINNISVKNYINQVSVIIRNRIIRKDSSLYNDKKINQDIIDSSLLKIYNDICSVCDLNYSRNIPLYIHNCEYLKTSMMFLPQILLSNKKSEMYYISSLDSFIHTFYYTHKSRILLTLVVKSDSINKFKKDLREDNIDPEITEIWVDKKFINSKDRKMFHKYIKETLLLQLAMEGFHIVEKDDILSELIYNPKITINSLSDLEKLKSNINKFLISDSKTKSVVEHVIDNCVLDAPSPTTSTEGTPAEDIMTRLHRILRAPLSGVIVDAKDSIRADTSEVFTIRLNENGDATEGQVLTSDEGVGTWRDAPEVDNTSEEVNTSEDELSEENELSEEDEADIAEALLNIQLR